MSLRKPRLAAAVGDGLGDEAFNPEDGKAPEIEQLHVVLKAIERATHDSGRGHRGDDSSEKFLAGCSVTSSQHTGQPQPRVQGLCKPDRG
jgi:hypothetical protein